MCDLLVLCMRAGVISDSVFMGCCMCVVACLCALHPSFLPSGDDCCRPEKEKKKSYGGYVEPVLGGRGGRVFRG